MNFLDDRKKGSGGFVEDSTRGSAFIRPVTFKKDLALQVRLESRTLATIALWMIKEGKPARSMSDLVFRSLEAMKEILVRDKVVGEVLDSNEARDILDMFNSKLNVRGLGIRNEIHNRVLSDRLSVSGSHQYKYKYQYEPLVDDEQDSKIIKQSNALANSSLPSGVQSKEITEMMKKLMVEKDNMIVLDDMIIDEDGDYENENE